MSERENRHVWDDVLGKTGAPPLADSWKAMERLLDKEMPTGPRRRGWRWLLLLLLLVGVCNYYRVGRPSGEQTASRPTAKLPTGPGTSAGASAGSASGIGAGATPRAGSGVSAGTSAGSGSGAGAGAVPPTGSGVGAGATSPTGSGVGSRAIPRTGSGVGAGVIPPTGSSLADQRNVAVDQGTSPAENGMAAAPDSMAGATTVARVDSTATGAAPKQPAKNTVPGDTTTRKPSKKIKVPLGPYKGFAAAIGFNQFFPLGPQENAHYNSNGTNGTITDYLPVPEGRYYFSRKLYVQAEVQFNSPQYTAKNLLAGQQVILDTTVSGLGLKTSNSVYIKKLYYFNLPLSLYYSPLKNLYLGTGLEYARLTNGVALFQQRNAAYFGPTVVTPDSVTYSKVQTFKGDSIYQRLRTNEWRVLFEANYQWKGFTLGLRYNRALDKFINIQVAGTGVTQSRNSSLQLYLRYTIWKQRSLKNKSRSLGK